MIESNHILTELKGHDRTGTSIGQEVSNKTNRYGRIQGINTEFRLRGVISLSLTPRTLCTLCTTDVDFNIRDLDANVDHIKCLCKNGITHRPDPSRGIGQRTTHEHVRIKTQRRFKGPPRVHGLIKCNCHLERISGIAVGNRRVVDLDAQNVRLSQNVCITGHYRIIDQRSSPNVTATGLQLPVSAKPRVTGSVIRGSYIGVGCSRQCGNEGLADFPLRNVTSVEHQVATVSQR